MRKGFYVNNFYSSFVIQMFSLGLYMRVTEDQ